MLLAGDWFVPGNKKLSETPDVSDDCPIHPLPLFKGNIRKWGITALNLSPNPTRTSLHKNHPGLRTAIITAPFFFHSSPALKVLCSVYTGEIASTIIINHSY